MQQATNLYCKLFWRFELEPASDQSHHVYVPLNVITGLPALHGCCPIEMQPKSTMLSSLASFL